MEKSRISEKASREFFSARFKVALDLWKEKTDGKPTQKAFAKKVFVHEVMINGYKNGSYPKPETMALILKEFQRVGLDITEEFFYPSSHSEKYVHDGVFVNGLIRDRIDYAEKIGVDINFLHFIWDNIDTSQYPVWSPLCEMSKADDPSSTEYRRQPLAKTEIDSGFLQVKTNEGKFLLSDVDIHILKDLQKQVECFIEYLFLQRKRDMDGQIEEANKQYQSVHEDGWTKYHTLSKEELTDIDSYEKYYYGRK